MSNGSGGVQNSFVSIYATTPMVLDIAAVQSRYGADPNTAVGDTTYSFSEATPFLYSIYDAGGSDTFDLSAITRGSQVDLRPGAYSSIGFYSLLAQIADAKAQFPEPQYDGFINGVFDDGDGRYRLHPALQARPARRVA